MALAPVVVALFVAACAPQPSASASTSSGPSPSGSEPSRSPSLAPAAAIIKRIPLVDLLALDPSADGVWYLRGGEERARVGRSDMTGSVEEADAGPAPIAISATAESVFVLEGNPTAGGTPARTNVLERLDPATLKVIASTPVEGLGTDLAIGNGKAWVVTTNGKVYAFDEATLRNEGDIAVTGRGPSRINVSGGFVWVINGQTANDGSTELLLHRIDADMSSSTVEVRNAGPSGALAVGTLVWVGAGAADPAGGQGALYPFAVDLTPEPELLVRRPIAMVESEGWLWWVTGAGELGAVNALTRTSRTTTTLGQTAVDLVSSGGRLWVASTDLIILDPGAP